MIKYFAVKSLPKSIFLAGPTPRAEGDAISWRPNALKILEELNFKGSVYIPESEVWNTKEEYLSQVEWEWEAMNISTVVVFWVPRNLKNMPAFTTNVEFGLMAHSNKAVLGYPVDAPKTGYLHALAARFDIPVASTLLDLLKLAITKTDKPFKSAIRHDIS